MQDRYRAVLIGCALGDTLGMAVEGWKREQIKKYVPGGITHPIDALLVRNEEGNEVQEDEFGKLKYWTRGLKAGEWTDDTIMTMDIAESIAELGRIDVTDITQRHVKTFDFYEKPGSGSHAFGGTTRKAIELIKQGTSVIKSRFYGWPGNAPAMKMHALGMYAHATGELIDAEKRAQEIGQITHQDPRSLASGMIQTRLIYTLLETKIPLNFKDSMLLACERYEERLTTDHKKVEAGTLLDKLRWVAQNEHASADEAFTYLGASSQVYSSYPFTLFMFQKHWDTPIKGLLETINYGGDCDTTGAIFGALAGARHGMVFPESWLSVLKEKDRLMKAADSIYSCRSRQ
ncbi:ADP-ribosylglycohydrolase family protein [Candidatus Pacearchaeota archaeon]|nr:ADP-ribosylglycohydrolase family protein [Candidatus Pacearchaeota archaeon]